MQQGRQVRNDKQMVFYRTHFNNYESEEFMQINDINHLTKIVGEDNIRSDIADRYVYGSDAVKAKQLTTEYHGTLR